MSLLKQWESQRPTGQKQQERDSKTSMNYINDVIWECHKRGFVRELRFELYDEEEGTDEFTYMS